MWYIGGASLIPPKKRREPQLFAGGVALQRREVTEMGTIQQSPLRLTSGNRPTQATSARDRIATGLVLGVGVWLAPAPTAAQSPLCTEQSMRAACWAPLADPPGCYVWIRGSRPDQVEWTGECSDAVAHGKGTLTFRREWTLGIDTWTMTGELRDGKYEGHWVKRLTMQIEGNGFKEGPYVNGERNGHWVERWISNGNSWLEEGPYVNGERNGHWVERLTRSSGSVDIDEGPYVNGLRHGYWDARSDEGVGYVGPLVHGSFSAEGTYYYDDGGRYQGQWDVLTRHGRGALYLANGDRYEGEWVNGKIDGPGTYYHADGDRKTETGMALRGCFYGDFGSRIAIDATMAECGFE